MDHETVGTVIMEGELLDKKEGDDEEDVDDDEEDVDDDEEDDDDTFDDVGNRCKDD